MSTDHRIAGTVCPYTFEADLPCGLSAPVYLSRGTKQGEIRFQLLFNLVFNALLIGIRLSYCSGPAEALLTTLH